VLADLGVEGEVAQGGELGERWFRELIDKALRRGVFHSVPDLITATAEDILAKITGGRIVIQAVNQ
jgi:hypothetical protein